jgi:hypothetical protein
MSSLKAIQIQEGDFTKEEHEGTAILVENDTTERVLQGALRDTYVKPYVIKIFNQQGHADYYRITRE